MNYLFKGGIFGAKGVGKSAILQSLSDSNGDIVVYDKQKNHDFKIKMIEDDVDLLKSADFALLTYDITETESYDYIQEFLISIMNQHNPNLKIILVGNKLDMENQRTVQTNNVEKFANQYQIFSIEISCATSKNLDVLIKYLRVTCNQSVQRDQHRYLRQFQSQSVPELPQRESPKTEDKRISVVEQQLYNNYGQSLWEEKLQQQDQTIDKLKQEIEQLKICKMEFNQKQEIYMAQQPSNQVQYFKIDSFQIVDQPKQTPNVPIVQASLIDDYPKEKPKQSKKNIFSQNGPPKVSNDKDNLQNDSVMKLNLNIEGDLFFLEVKVNDSPFTLVERVVSQSKKTFSRRQIQRLADIIKQSINDKINEYTLLIEKLYNPQKPCQPNLVIGKLIIDIGKEKKVDIVVKDQDDPSTLAKNFANVYNLKRDATVNLEQKLQALINQYKLAQ